MPNRIIKESINESRGLTSCSFFAQDLYKRLLTYADDYGRFNADPQIMVARLYPRELSVVSIDDLIDGLIELVGVGKIQFYTAKPRKEIYGCFPNWGEHQRLRESKVKCPDPDDTTVNDWYYRRFIPMALKEAILVRDGFKCQQCGKHISEMTDAHKLIKMATGTFHIDHIVPCSQGGRATMENLQLLCPKCNLTRKKHFTFEEILDFPEHGDASDNVIDCGELRRDAASCGEPPRVAASCGLNPIQSNTNTESNPIRKSARFAPPSLDEVKAYCKERGNTVDPQHFVDYYQSNGWKVGRNPMKDWKAAVRSWEQREKGKNTSYPSEPTKTPEEDDKAARDLLAKLKGA